MTESGCSHASRSRMAWLAGYAAVSFLAFPHPIAGRVIDLGIVFAWLAPALLLLGLAELRPGRAARLGFMAGLAAHTAIFYWFYVVTVHYGHAPVIAGLASPLVPGCYIAAFIAIFATGWAWLVRARLDSPWTAAVWWTASEYLRSFARFPQGLPPRQ